jgi:hypothetical protein
MQTILRVKSVRDTKAIMEDGREVMLGPIQNVGKGDYLRVYTNVAIDKVSSKKG